MNYERALLIGGPLAGHLVDIYPGQRVLILRYAPTEDGTRPQIVHKKFRTEGLEEAHYTLAHITEPYGWSHWVGTPASEARGVWETLVRSYAEISGLSATPRQSAGAV